MTKKEKIIIAAVLAAVCIAGCLIYAWIARERTLEELVGESDYLITEISASGENRFSYEPSEEVRREIAAMLSTAVFQRDIWNGQFHTAPGQTKYRIEIFRSGDFPGYRAAEFLVATQGDCLLYLYDNDRNCSTYNVVSFDGVFELVKYLEGLA